MAMNFTITAETSIELDEDKPSWQWLNENANFEHKRDCEFIVHIGSDADEEGSYFKGRLAEMEAAGAVELAAEYKLAKEAGAVRLLVWPD